MGRCGDYKEHCQPAKMISCVMERGHGEKVVQELYKKKHILGIEYSAGRNQQSPMGLKEWQEVDMLMVVVSPEYAEEVFNDMYHLAKIAETEGGIIFQTDLLASTNYCLPDLTDLSE